MSAAKQRETVRVRPFVMPSELRTKILCANCQGQATSDAYVLFIDSIRNGNDVKAESVLACNATCMDLLHQALTVEYALVGVKEKEAPEAQQEENSQDA